MDERACIKIAEDAFQRIGSLLPSLELKKNVSDPVELSINIPVQPGLKYAVNLNFQNRDELHSSIGNFWLEWFPCTDPARVEAYIVPGREVGFFNRNILLYYDPMVEDRASAKATSVGIAGK